MEEQNRNGYIPDTCMYPFRFSRPCRRWLRHFVQLGQDLFEVWQPCLINLPPANNALRIYQEHRTITASILFVVSAVKSRDVAFGMEIAQHGKRDAAQFFRKGCVRIDRIHADAHDLSMGRFKALQLALKGLQFARSAAGEIKYVKGQRHFLLAAIVAERR